MKASLIPRRRPLIARAGPISLMMNRFEDEMGGLMERFFGDDGGWEGGDFVPTTDVAETKNAFVVTVDLPGMKPEEVKVELQNGNLWVWGKREEEKEEKEKTYHRIERRYGEFRRVLPLPASIDEARVEAKFEHGVLTITVPKAEEAKAKAIEVKA